MDKYHLNAAYEWSKASTRLIVTPSQMAKSMFFCVQEVGHLYTLPKYYTERANLNSYLIVYTQNGIGELTYRGKRYTVKSGQAFFIDCQEYQYYKTDPDQLWDLLFVHFYGSSSRLYYEQYIKHGNPVIIDEDSMIPAYINQLIELHQKTKDMHTEALSSKWITDLLTDMLLKSLKTNQDLHPSLVPDFIVKTTDYLEKRYREKITLDLLSAEMAVSKFHLAKTFKKHIGSTPYDYLFTIRINAAKALLKYSDLQIAEIAEHAGFNHTSHFIRLFKHQEGTTPLRFRKEWQRH